MPIIVAQFPELGTRVIKPNKKYDPDTLNRLGRFWVNENSAARFYGETNGIIPNVTSLKAADLHDKSEFLLPISYNDYHWVSLGIKVTRQANGTLHVHIGFTDSLYQARSLPSWLHPEIERIKKLFKSHYHLNDGQFQCEVFQHSWQQEDQVSCGVFAIENAKRFLNPKDTRSNPGHITLREEQLSRIGFPAHITRYSSCQELDVALITWLRTKINTLKENNLEPLFKSIHDDFYGWLHELSTTINLDEFQLLDYIQNEYESMEHANNRQLLVMQIQNLVITARQASLDFGGEVSTKYVEEFQAEKDDFIKKLSELYEIITKSVPKEKQDLVLIQFIASAYFGDDLKLVTDLSIFFAPNPIPDTFIRIYQILSHLHDGAACPETWKELGQACTVLHIFAHSLEATNKAECITLPRASQEIAKQELQIHLKRLATAIKRCDESKILSVCRLCLAKILSWFGRHKMLEIIHYIGGIFNQVLPKANHDIKTAKEILCKEQDLLQDKLMTAESKDKINKILIAHQIR